MSTEENSTDPSRLTNGTNSVNGPEAGNGPDLLDELPSPSERAAEFDETFPERSKLPLTRRDGRRLRRSLVEVHRTTRTTEEIERINEDAQEVTEVHRIEPLTWGAAVEDLLRDHQRMRQTTLHFEHDDGTEWERPSSNRWTAAYQKKYFAQMKGWLRELTGGTRPSGGETDASFDDPTICLITRSASSTPDGQRLAPTDHAAALADSWSSVYHTLRNTMRSLGFELGADWQYDRREEPHTGKRGTHGTNVGYGHEHIVLVVDGAISPGDLRPVVEKHVDACDYAGPTAHDLDRGAWDLHPDEVGTVEVFEPDEVDDIAAYVADYCSIEPTDLFDRSTTYQAWAATKHATNTRAISRSTAAKHAATADRCRQRCDDGQAEQDVGHGEEVVRAADGARHDLECAECGSPHDIDQTTLSRARLDAQKESHASTSAPTDDDDWTDPRLERLREVHDEDAVGSVASVGESLERARVRDLVQQQLELDPDVGHAELAGRLQERPELVESILEEERMGYDPDEAVGWHNPPDPGWSLTAVSVNDETHRVACDGGGPEMVRTRLPSERIRRETDLKHGGDGIIKWRCRKCRHSTWDTKGMARHLVSCVGGGDDLPTHIASEMLIADRVHSRAKNRSDLIDKLPSSTGSSSPRDESAQ